MIRLLRWLIYGDAHTHVWKTIKEVELVDEKDNQIGTRYYCECSVCGTHKVFG